MNDRDDRSAGCCEPQALRRLIAPGIRSGWPRDGRPTDWQPLAGGLGSTRRSRPAITRCSFVFSRHPPLVTPSGQKDTQCNSTPIWEEGSQSPGFLDSEALRSAVAMAGISWRWLAICAQNQHRLIEMRVQRMMTGARSRFFGELNDRDDRFAGCCEPPALRCLIAPGIRSSWPRDGRPTARQLPAGGLGSTRRSRPAITRCSCKSQPQDDQSSTGRPGTR